MKSASWTKRCLISRMPGYHILCDQAQKYFWLKINLFIFQYWKKVKICQFYGMLFGIEIQIMQPIAHFGNWPFNEIFFVSRPLWGLIWIQVDTFWIQVIQMDRAWNSDQFNFWSLKIKVGYFLSKKTNFWPIPSSKIRVNLSYLPKIWFFCPKFGPHD